MQIQVRRFSSCWFPASCLLDASPFLPHFHSLHPLNHQPPHIPRPASGRTAGDSCRDGRGSFYSCPCWRPNKAAECFLLSVCIGCFGNGEAQDLTGQLGAIFPLVARGLKGEKDRVHLDLWPLFATCHPELMVSLQKSLARTCVHK